VDVKILGSCLMVEDTACELEIRVGDVAMWVGGAHKVVLDSWWEGSPPEERGWGSPKVGGQVQGNGTWHGARLGEPDASGPAARSVMAAQEGWGLWDKFLKLGWMGGEFSMEGAEVCKNGMDGRREPDVGRGVMEGSLEVAEEAPGTG